jgi:CheY-like chemotaxis protein
MPARIVVVLDDPGFADRIASVLKGASYDAVAVVDPQVAIDALRHTAHIELLITCPEFAPGQPTGISVMRTARMERPYVKALFIGRSELAIYVQSLGMFLATPVTVAEVVDAAVRMLDDQTSAP